MIESCESLGEEDLDGFYVCTLTASIVRGRVRVRHPPICHRHTVVASKSKTPLSGIVHEQVQAKLPVSVWPLEGQRSSTTCSTGFTYPYHHSTLYEEPSNSKNSTSSANPYVKPMKLSNSLALLKLLLLYARDSDNPPTVDVGLLT